MSSCFLKFLFSFSKFIHIFVLFCSIKFFAFRFFFKNYSLFCWICFRKFCIFEVFMLQESRISWFDTQQLWVSFWRSIWACFRLNLLLMSRHQELFLQDWLLFNLENNILRIIFWIPRDWASLYPSGHSLLSGVPKIFTILFSWSVSLLPGKRGQKLYSSAIMQPRAKISTGEL